MEETPKEFGIFGHQNRPCPRCLAREVVYGWAYIAPNLLDVFVVCNSYPCRYIVRFEFHLNADGTIESLSDILPEFTYGQFTGIYQR